MKVLSKIVLTAFILMLLPMMYNDAAEAGWSEMDSVTEEHLYGIWGSSGSDVFAVGSFGTIVHYDGTSWSKMDSDMNESLKGIWGSSYKDVFAVGNSGTVLHYKGSSWREMDNKTTELLYGIWGSSEEDVFAVGGGGIILYYDDDDWTVKNSPTTVSLYGVWVSSEEDGFAVGWDGKILHYNGSRWSRKESGTEKPLYGIWGSSGTDVFAVGEDGTILQYGGEDWSVMKSATSKTLRDIWCSSSSDVFAVGDEGRIVHYDGEKWSIIIMDSPTTVSLYGVWGSSGTDVFAVGQYGTIMHYAAVTTTSTTTSVTSTTSTTTSVTPTTTTTAQSTTTTSIPERTVDFVGSPTSGPRPLKVRFTSFCEGDISDYHWDFGDGSETTENPNPSHTYNDVGTYSVILTVTFADGTEDKMVEEEYITVLPRYSCAFTSALVNKNDIHVLRDMRDSMPDNIHWFAIASIYYNSSSEVASVLQGNSDLKDRLRQLVSGNIEIAEQLTAEREITVDENVINEMIIFLNDLKSEGSPTIQSDIDYVIRGIEDGYLLNGLGIYVD